jgi:hypothetical protein
MAYREVLAVVAVTLCLGLSACISPGEYVDAEGHELRNNCLIQSMCLDLPANRPGTSYARAPDGGNGTALMGIGAGLLQQPPMQMQPPMLMQPMQPAICTRVGNSVVCR